MLTEACYTGRPVHIFDLAKPDTPWWRQPGAFRWKPLSHRVGTALGPSRMARDVTRIHDRLVAEGRAVRLGDPVDTSATSSSPDDLERAADRVRALFANSHTVSVTN